MGSLITLSGYIVRLIVCSFSISSLMAVHNNDHDRLWVENGVNFDFPVNARKWLPGEIIQLLFKEGQQLLEVEATAQNSVGL